MSGLGGLAVWQMLHQQRARADQAQFAFDQMEELRQFANARGRQERPQAVNRSCSGSKLRCPSISSVLFLSFTISNASESRRVGLVGERWATPRRSLTRRPEPSVDGRVSTARELATTSSKSRHPARTCVVEAVGRSSTPSPTCATRSVRWHGAASLQRRVTTLPGFPGWYARGHWQTWPSQTEDTNLPRRSCPLRR